VPLPESMSLTCLERVPQEVPETLETPEDLGRAGLEETAGILPHFRAIRIAQMLVRARRVEQATAPGIAETPVVPEQLLAFFVYLYREEQAALGAPVGQKVIRVTREVRGVSVRQHLAATVHPAVPEEQAVPEMPEHLRGGLGPQDTSTFFLVFAAVFI
jgi:hypothetical protein